MLAMKVQLAELNKIFDRQLKTLADKNCPTDILMDFQKQREEVLLKTIGFDYSENIIPFLPIIPQRKMNIIKQLSMIDGGWTHIHDNDIVNSDEKDEPYFIYNVEDGTSTVNKIFVEIDRMTKKGNRKYLNIYEGISLAIHSDVLYKHGISCLGSRFEKYKKSATIIYRVDNIINIHWMTIDNIDKQFGFASKIVN